MRNTSSTSQTDPLQLLVLEGDGIGPEITASTLMVLHAVAELFNIKLKVETAAIGFKALQQTGTTLPDPVLARAREVDGIILGPVSHNEYPPATDGGINPSGVLRRQLDLYANIRPAVTLEGLPPRCGSAVDLIVVRENTEGFYADRSMFAGPGEFMPTEDIALAVRKVTRKASIRIAQTAFAIAAKRRRKVTVVHKANVLRLSDGLFLDCTREVAARFPDVEYEEQLIDSMAALLVRDASVFDVIVTTNMYGDILSDQASEIAGSLGLAASLNSGDHHGMAQAQHGSAPSLTDKDTANPSSLIASAAMLLQWLGDNHSNSSIANNERYRVALCAASSAIQNALQQTISKPHMRTADIGGSLGTMAFTNAVIAQLKNLTAS